MQHMWHVHVVEAAALCTRGCSLMHQRPQPCALRAACSTERKLTKMARKPVTMPPLTIATLRLVPTTTTVKEASMSERGQPKFCRSKYCRGKCIE